MHPTHHQPNPSPDVDETPARVLRDAATYLDRHGWTQGNFYKHFAHDAMPAACAVGAIRMAVFGAPTQGSAYLTDTDGRDLSIRAAGVLADYLGIDPADIDSTETDPSTAVTRWNDRDDRSRFDVTEALRAAADTWDTDHTGGAA